MYTYTYLDLNHKRYNRRKSLNIEKIGKYPFNTTLDQQDIRE